jgi:hypothetical protein
MTDVSAELQRLGALVRQLQDALVGSKIVHGSVSSAGAILSGSGFTITKTGTGAYTITFTTAFASKPTVVPAVVSTGTGIRNQAEPVVGSATVLTYNSSTLAVLDAPFHFFAIGP